MKPRILALCGSSRPQGSNRKLLDMAVAGARSAGAEVTDVGLARYELPVYDAEWETEHGIPEAVRELRGLVAENQGLLIASPEHNGGYSALLKNSIDWISRTDEFDRRGPRVFAGKTAVILSATTDDDGGLKAQFALNMVLHRLGVLVLPASFALGDARRTFAQEGSVRLPTARALAINCGETLVRITGLLHPKTDLAPAIAVQ